jgi:uncharacterized protein (DUF433 family)
MNWTDCPIIEQIPGKMSGAPVLRGTRLRPQDITGNAEMGAAWISEAFGISAEDVQTVLAFHAEHFEELPLEYISPERITALGIEDIDWSDCPMIERSPDRLAGEPAIRGTPVRTVDLLVNRDEGEDGLARMYDLPRDTIRSVLNYYDQHHRQGQFAPSI